LHVSVTYLHRVDPGSDRSSGPSNARWWGRRPQRTHLPLQGEAPHRITIGATALLITTSSDSDVLLAVHLIDHGRCVSPRARLEEPQRIARRGTERQEVGIRSATEDETTGRDGPATSCANAVWRFVLPGDFVRLAIDGRERAAHW